MSRMYQEFFKRIVTGTLLASTGGFIGYRLQHEFKKAEIQELQKTLMKQIPNTEYSLLTPKNSVTKTFTGSPKATMSYRTGLVMGTENGSQAWANEIQKGWVLASINGKLLGHNYRQALKEAIKSGSDYEVTFNTDIQNNLDVYKNNFGPFLDWDGYYGKDGQSTVDKYVYLVRHPQYDYETGEITELGVKQAHKTGERFQKIQEYMKPGEKFVVYSSPKIRAKQMTEIVMKYLHSDTQVIYMDELKEVMLPSEGYSEKENKEFEKNTEPLKRVLKKHLCRADAEATKTVHTIVIGHLNVIRYHTLSIMQLPVMKLLRFSGFNCGLTRIRLLPSGGTILEMYGDIGHLDPKDVTWNTKDFFDETIKAKPIPEEKIPEKTTENTEKKIVEKKE